MKTFINDILLRILNKVDRYHQNLIYKGYREKYFIHQTFGFSGKDISFNGNGKIICGKDSYIGRRSLLVCEGDRYIKIGKKTRISMNVAMFTISAISDQDFSKDYVKYKMGDIVIGDYVWIGKNVFINPGIVIGDNSIVGANSVVTHDIMANSIYAGTPAKFIKYKTKKVLFKDYGKRKEEIIKKMKF